MTVAAGVHACQRRGVTPRVDVLERSTLGGKVLRRFAFLPAPWSGIPSSSKSCFENRKSAQSLSEATRPG
jgi:hypothetical protein